MKTKFLFIATVLAAVLTSCIKDKNYKTYTIYKPHFSVKQEIKEAAKLQNPESLKNLGSFALYRGAMYINEKNKGIHVIDYRNPSAPVNKGFIPIPGNLGLSIKNDVLYADCYCDLLVFKLSSNDQITLVNTIENTFLSRMSTFDYDSNAVTLTWIKKDTTVSQEYYNQHYYNQSGSNFDHMFTSNMSNTQGIANFNPPGNNTSVGSSMAVFAIVNDYLYTVDQSNLNSFSLADPMHPALKNSQHITWNVETIFPFKDKLFIGSMTGMFIYGITNPSEPNYISQFNHVRVCDPVIADDRFAFVTLRSGTQCGGFVNQLDVLNIETITDPVLIKSFPFSNPHGLSKNGNVLFICDGDAGLKVVDANDVNNLDIKHSLNIGKAIDVIALDGFAIVMLDNAIHIYQYDQAFNIHLLSSIHKS